MKTGDRGQVLVVVALVFVVLLGFAALAVDVGYMYTVRHELQRCADAGALAGASIFRDGGTWLPTLDPVTSPPAVFARDYASADNVLTTPLDRIGEVEVAFLPPLLDNQIRVTVHRNVRFFFAPIFGMPNWTVSASAVARSYYRAGPPPDNSIQLVE